MSVALVRRTFCRDGVPDSPWLYTVFFFSSRRRHTRSDRDWSSDVCSSDLVALARIGGFTRAAHVQDEPRIGQIICDVNHALQFIHGLDAPDALHFANGKRRSALAHGAQIPAGRCVERSQLQAMRLKGAGHRAYFWLHRVFEMAARAENLNAL